MVKRKHLTLKQQGFIRRVVETRNATKAAADVYDTTYEVARRIGSENLAKPVIRQEVERQLASVGLNHTKADQTLQAIIDSGTENLNATKPDTTLKAIITLNKLLDRFPADKRIEARIDVAKMYQQRTTSDIESELVAIQQQNQQLLNEIKRNKQK
jgi:phage terminase small subunit